MKVKVYSTNQCPFCHMAKDFLKEHKIEFEDINVGENQEAAKEMIKQSKGNIVNIAGASAHRCYAENGAFGPSKAAVINLTKQMALEWGRYGVRVNVVSPGPTKTAATTERLKDEKIKSRVEKIPMGRVAEKDEVARVVVFLASEDSSFVTSQALIVDGGGIHTWYLYP